MLEGLQQLIDLQGLDDEIAALETEHAEVPTRRGEFQQQRSACEAKVAQITQVLHDAEHSQREVESRLQDQEALLQRLLGQQFQVKSNDAYTALLHEIEQAKRAISDCETGILEAMDAIETARVHLAAAETEERETRTRLEGEERALDTREKQLGEDLARSRARRDDVSSRIQAGLLGRYTRIARRRQPAVVLISNEMCVGCRVDIPPQNYIEILKGESVVTCGQCQRILVHAAKLPEVAAR